MDKKTIWWMFGVTKGGTQRAHIVKSLKEMPSNANRLAQRLNLDYKTVRYHLDMLVKNKFAVRQGAPITMYFLSDEFEKDYDEFLKIYEQIEERQRITYKTVPSKIVLSNKINSHKL